MVLWEEEIANTTGVATTYTAMTGSPFSPKKSGKLVKLKLFVAGDAVTSLVEMVKCRLRCALWGITPEITTVGANLRTAPAFTIPVGEAIVDLPVQTGVNIEAEYKHQTGATPVTPRISLVGVFQG